MGAFILSSEELYKQFQFFSRTMRIPISSITSEKQEQEQTLYRDLIRYCIHPDFENDLEAFIFQQDPTIKGIRCRVDEYQSLQSNVQPVIANWFASWYLNQSIPPDCYFCQKITVDSIALHSHKEIYIVSLECKEINYTIKLRYSHKQLLFLDSLFKQWGLNIRCHQLLQSKSCTLSIDQKSTWILRYLHSDSSSEQQGEQYWFYSILHCNRSQLIRSFEDSVHKGFVPGFHPEAKNRYLVSRIPLRRFEFKERRMKDGMLRIYGTSSKYHVLQFRPRSTPDSYITPIIGIIEPNGRLHFYGSIQNKEEIIAVL